MLGRASSLALPTALALDGLNGFTLAVLEFGPSEGSRDEVSLNSTLMARAEAEGERTRSAQ